jgi:hypothetical protein
MLVLLTLAGVLAAMLVVGTATAQTSDGSHWAHPTVLHAQMTGEKEVPGPGDPNGFGRAVVILVAPNNVCYALTAHDIAPATGAHIHRGPPRGGWPRCGAAPPAYLGRLGRLLEGTPSDSRQYRGAPLPLLR